MLHLANFYLLMYSKKTSPAVDAGDDLSLN